MAMREWKPDEFIAAVNAVFAERGDEFTYRVNGAVRDCAYFEADPEEPDGYIPSCLIGAALDKMGFGPGDIVEGQCASGVLTRLFMVDEEDPVVIAANAAQDSQDCGTRYGDVRGAWEEKIG